jgi:hypothetical protein
VKQFLQNWYTSDTGYLRPKHVAKRYTWARINVAFDTVINKYKTNNIYATEYLNITSSHKLFVNQWTEEAGNLKLLHLWLLELQLSGMWRRVVCQTGTNVQGEHAVMTLRLLITLPQQFIFLHDVMKSVDIPNSTLKTKPEGSSAMLAPVCHTTWRQLS